MEGYEIAGRAFKCFHIDGFQGFGFWGTLGFFAGIVVDRRDVFLCTEYPEGEKIKAGIISRALFQIVLHIAAQRYGGHPRKPASRFVLHWNKKPNYCH